MRTTYVLFPWHLQAKDWISKGASPWRIFQGGKAEQVYVAEGPTVAQAQADELNSGKGQFDLWRWKPRAMMPVDQALDAIEGAAVAVGGWE